MKKRWFIFFALVLLACVIAAFFLLRHPEPASVTESLSTAEAPWPAEAEHLDDRLHALGFPLLSTEGTALHTHQHLDIFVHGKPVAVPPGIGIHEAFPSFIAPLHVHDETGIIHVESPTVETFTLGQFFDVWGVRLSAECMGGYCADATNTLRVFVNGTLYEGDPREIVLDAHEEIAIVFGTADELPAILPMTYSFPEGY